MHKNGKFDYDGGTLGMGREIFWYCRTFEEGTVWLRDRVMCSENTK